MERKRLTSTGIARLCVWTRSWIPFFSRGYFPFPNPLQASQDGVDFKEYYQTIGVEKDATQDEIKRAYRKLARKYHPDVSKEPDAEARFKEIGEAHDVLGDPDKRAAYDKLASGARSGQDFTPPPDWDAGFEFRGGGFEGGGGDSYSDFFEAIFGQRMGSTRARTSSAGFQAKGEDHHAKVLIDLEDAYQGAARAITLRNPELDAGGQLVYKKHTLSVRIPKGLKKGQKIRLAGQGSPGMGGGEAGDLFLEIGFNPHPLYRIDGRDLYLDLPVAPWEAALGATVQIPTPGGTVGLKIPAGTTTGRKLRLKGLGIPATPPGDIFAVPQIVLPPATTDSAKDLYRKMESELAFDPRSELGV